MIAIAALFGVYVFIEFMRREHLDLLHTAGGLLICFAIGAPLAAWLASTMGIGDAAVPFLAVPIGIGVLLSIGVLMRPKPAAQKPTPIRANGITQSPLHDAELIIHAEKAGRSAKENGNPEHSCHLIGVYREAWLKGYRDAAERGPEEPSTPEVFPTKTAIITVGIILLVTAVLFLAAP